MNSAPSLVPLVTPVFSRSTEIKHLSLVLFGDRQGLIAVYLHFETWDLLSLFSRRDSPETASIRIRKRVERHTERERERERELVQNLKQNKAEWTTGAPILVWCPFASQDSSYSFIRIFSHPFSFYHQFSILKVTRNKGCQ
jgi:hypothetical protein